jgi:Beta-lactamase
VECPTRTARLLWIVIPFLVAAGSSRAASHLFDEVARLSEEARRDWDAPGLSVAIVVDGKIAWARGFGLADVGNDVPARADTVYRKPGTGSRTEVAPTGGSTYLPRLPERRFAVAICANVQDAGGDGRALAMKNAELTLGE